MPKRKNTMFRSMLFASAVTLAVIGSANAVNYKWTDDETAAGLKKIEITRYAFAGHKINLFFLVALEVDCSVTELYQASIVKEPEHGIAEITPHTDFSSYAKDNPRSKCNETKVAGEMLSYKGKDGYAGPDNVTVLEVFPGGLAREVTFILNVRAFKPTRSAGTPPPRIKPQ